MSGVTHVVFLVALHGALRDVADVVGHVAGRNQHGRDGGLGGAVHVRRAVEQLCGRDPLGDQPEETQFDVT